MLCGLKESQNHIYCLDFVIKITSIWKLWLFDVKDNKAQSLLRFIEWQVHYN